MGSNDCILGVAGSCVLGDSSRCIKPMAPGTLPPVYVVFVQGYADSLEITWETVHSYPDQTVTILMQDQNGDYFDKVTVARDDGTISIGGLDANKTYYFFIRPEDPVQGIYGEWTRSYGITDPAWDSSAQTVEYNGEPVFYGTDVVLYS